jgi:hypothetical protein
MTTLTFYGGVDQANKSTPMSKAVLAPAPIVNPT